MAKKKRGRFMIGNINTIDWKIRSYWKNYVFQCLIATIAIFAVLMLLRLEHTIIIASIGSTVFIVFARPQSITAKPRNLIGGHIIGLITGSLIALIPHKTFLFTAIIYSLAVGVSIFLMVVTDTEHPPASGTALGVAIEEFSLEIAIAIITSVIILSVIHKVFKKYIRDLT